MAARLNPIALLALAAAALLTAALVETLSEGADLPPMPGRSWR